LFLSQIHARRGLKPKSTCKRVRIAAGHGVSSSDRLSFKIKWGNLTLKIYDKGGRVRIEVVVHNAKELRSGKMLASVTRAHGDMLVRFVGSARQLPGRGL
jgi:hypothetical protein